MCRLCTYLAVPYYPNRSNSTPFAHGFDNIKGYEYESLTARWAQNSWIQGKAANGTSFLKLFLLVDILYQTITTMIFCAR